jgi:hypothetical protein
LLVEEVFEGKSTQTVIMINTKSKGIYALLLLAQYGFTVVEIIGRFGSAE